MGNLCARGAHQEQDQSMAVNGYPTGKKRSKEERYEQPMSIVNKKNQVLPDCKNVKCFCYDILRSATKKFSDKNLLGQGGFGDVYKGWIGDCHLNAASRNGGLAVAIKRLLKTGPCGYEEWMNEIAFLSRLSNPNIVKLVGYCCEDDHRILVYEYMARGSLESHLSGEESAALNWSRRIKIAIGAAKGLNYLHNRGVPVIHRDIKASNVLLDKGRSKLRFTFQF